MCKLISFTPVLLHKSSINNRAGRYLLFVSTGGSSVFIESDESRSIDQFSSMIPFVNRREIRNPAKITSLYYIGSERSRYPAHLTGFSQSFVNYNPCPKFKLAGTSHLHSCVIAPGLNGSKEVWQRWFNHFRFLFIAAPRHLVLPLFGEIA